MNLILGVLSAGDRGCHKALSGNFQKLGINTYRISACMIHHQKNKNLNFMMSYVRLRKITPV